MKTASHLALTVVVSVASAVTATLLLAPRPEPVTATDGAAEGRLHSALTALQQAQAEQRATLDSLALRVGTSAPAPRELPLAELESAVARALDERLAAQASLAAGEAGAEAAAAEEFDLDAAIATLLETDLGEVEREELWQQIRDAGLMDAAVAIFEARAKANPNDPALQVDLAGAYLQKLFEVGSGPLAGVWATKADAAYDAALALDNHHWDARFEKAVSLAFWPPIFGKQAEAIGHFETLLQQQVGQPAQPEFAQTYLWLGNLYQQQGAGEKAIALWKSGLELFPQNAELMAKMAAGG
jgi:tetratricopeptide (TPR) repeat protein